MRSHSIGFVYPCANNDLFQHIQVLKGRAIKFWMHCIEVSIGFLIVELLSSSSVCFMRFEVSFEFLYTLFGYLNLSAWGKNQLNQDKLGSKNEQEKSLKKGELVWDVAPLKGTI